MPPSRFSASPSTALTPARRTLENSRALHQESRLAATSKSHAAPTLSPAHAALPGEYCDVSFWGCFEPRQAFRRRPLMV